MIVAATPAHASALAAIHASAFPPREAWGEDAITIQLALPGAFGLIDDRGGMLLGRMAADEAVVLTLAVAPEARRQGIATALIRALGEIAKARGAWVMFVQADRTDPPAIRLYESLGTREDVHHFDIAPRE